MHKDLSFELINWVWFKVRKMRVLVDSLLFYTLYSPIRIYTHIMSRATLAHKHTRTDQNKFIDVSISIFYTYTFRSKDPWMHRTAKINTQIMVIRAPRIVNESNLNLCVRKVNKTMTHIEFFCFSCFLSLSLTLRNLRKTCFYICASQHKIFELPKNDYRIQVCFPSLASVTLVDLWCNRQ